MCGPTRTVSFIIHIIFAHASARQYINVHVPDFV